MLKPPLEQLRRTPFGLPTSPTWAVCCLLALHVCVAFLTRRTAVAYDDLRYLLLGRSLRNFEYVNQFEVGSPPHLLYPPGYPALLALVGSVIGDRPGTLVIVNIAASGLTLLFAYLIARRFLPTGHALLSLAILAMHPAVLASAGELTSEAPYAALSTAALWMLMRGRSSTRDAVLIAVLAVLATLTRTAGVTLLATILACWALDRHWRRVLAFLVFTAGTVGLWLLYAFASPDRYVRKSYAADFAGQWQSGDIPAPVRFVNRAVMYLEMLPRPFPQTALALPRPVMIMAGGVAVGIVILGIFQIRVRRPIEFYLGFYALLLLAWYPVARLLTVVLPLLVPLFVAGARRLYAERAVRYPVVTLCALALLLFGYQVAENTAEEVGRIEARRESRGDAAVLAAYRYIDRELPVRAVILSGHPEAVYYYTGRRGLARELVSNSPVQEFVPALRSKDVAYVLLAQSRFDRGTLLQRLAANCSTFSFEAAFQARLYLFELSPSSRPPDARACSVLDEFRRTHGEVAED
jgi:hypothetical protein